MKQNPSTQPSGESSIRFRRDYFIDSLSVRNEWVEFPESLFQEFHYYLVGSLSNAAARIYEQEYRTGYNTESDILFRRSAEYRLDSFLVETLGDKVGGSYKPVVSKLLNNPLGWIIAIQFLEYRTELLLFATGFHAVVNVPKFHSVFGFLQRPFSPGVTIDIEPSAAASTAILSSSSQCAYIRHMFAVEPKDFVVEIDPQTGKEEVKRRPDWIPESGVNANDIRAGIVKRLLMRQKFYLALQVPVGKLDAMPDEYLLKSGDEELIPEKLGVHWQNRYEELFHPKGSDQTAIIQRSLNTRLEVLKEDIDRLQQIA